MVAMDNSSNSFDINAYKSQIEKIETKCSDTVYNPDFHRKLNECRISTEKYMAEIIDDINTYTLVFSSEKTELDLFDKVACYILKTSSAAQIYGLLGIYKRYNKTDRITTELKNMVRDLEQIKRDAGTFLQGEGISVDTNIEVYKTWMQVNAKEFEKRELIRKNMYLLNQDIVDLIEKIEQGTKLDLKSCIRSYDPALGEIIQKIAYLEDEKDALWDKKEALCSKESYTREHEDIRNYVQKKISNAKKALEETEDFYKAVNGRIKIQEDMLNLMSYCENSAVKSRLDEMLKSKRDSISSVLAEYHAKHRNKTQQLNTRLNILASNTGLNEKELRAIYASCRNFGDIDFTTLKYIKEGRINPNKNLNKPVRTKESHILENAGINELEHICAWIKIQKDIDDINNCLHRSAEILNTDTAFVSAPGNICSCVKPLIEEFIELKKLHQSID